MTDKALSRQIHQIRDRLSACNGRPGKACDSCAARPLAFCGQLDAHAVEHIHALSRRLSVEAHKPILYEGDPADYTFNVLDGVVRLSKILPDGRRQITGFLFPGQYLGLSDRETYSCSADAVTDTVLCRFERKSLMALADEIPEVNHRLLTMAIDELAAAQEQFVLLGRKTARERVVSFLLKMNANRLGTSANEIELPMTRGDIADYLGLTIETVSRILNRLAKEGVIELATAHRIVLKDIIALKACDAGVRPADLS